MAFDMSGKKMQAVTSLKGVPSDMPIIRDHIAHLERLNRQPRSVYQRARCLRRLAAFIAPTPILEAGLDELRAFTSRPTKTHTPRSAASTKSEVNHVRGFYRWAVCEELRVDDPTTRLERPKVPRRYPRPMPDGDVTLALTTAPDRIRPWLYLAAYAGLRAAEIAGLRAEDIRGGRIYVIGKGGDEDSVPVAPILEPIFAVLPATGWLFPKGMPRHGGGRPPLDGPVTPSQVSKLANLWLHEQGVTHTLHTLRHWFGTEFYRRCRDLRRTQEAMRHRDSSSTEGYTLIDDDDIATTIGELRDLAAAA